MDFLNPIAFWGLLSLIIPLVVHLLSKRKKNQVFFGSNRFLADQETTSASSIQLSDFTLLLIRLLLLGTLVTAIAGFAMINDNTKQFIYLEQTLQSGDYKSIIPEDDSNIIKKYFSFNPNNKTSEVEYYPSAYTLIHKLNQIKDSVIVYSHSLQKDFKGSKVAPNKNIEWRILPKKEVVALESIDTSPLTLNIICAEKSANHKSDFENVISSLGEFLPFEIKYQTEAEWKILIDTLSQGNRTNTISWETNNETFSFEKSFNAFTMKGAMNKKAFLDSNFPLELTQVLINSRTSSNKNENYTFDPSTIEENNRNTILKAESPKSYLSKANYVWLLVIALLFLERFYSLRISAK